MRYVCFYTIIERKYNKYNIKKIIEYLILDIEPEKDILIMIYILILCDYYKKGIPDNIPDKDIILYYNKLNKDLDELFSSFEILKF